MARFNKKDEMLKKALKDMDGDGVRKALEDGADPNVYVFSTPAVVWSVQKRKTTILRLLVNAGADIEQKDDLDGRDGDTAVLRAACLGNKDALNFLAESGADFNAQDRFGNTPLILAARHSTADIVRTLLSHGANPELENSEGCTPLLEAADCKNTDVVIAIAPLVRNVDKPDRRERRGRTALSYAAGDGNHAAVKALLQAGADVNMLDSNGETVLMWTVRQAKNPDMIPILVSAGADVNVANTKGNTAMTYAVLNSPCGPDAVRALLECGSHVNAVHNGTTPLMLAALWDFSGLAAKVLVDAGADMFFRDSSGANPLKAAETMENVDSFAVLALAEGFTEETLPELIRGLQCKPEKKKDKQTAMAMILSSVLPEGYSRDLDVLAGADCPGAVRVILSIDGACMSYDDKFKALEKGHPETRFLDGRNDEEIVKILLHVLDRNPEKVISFMSDSKILDTWAKNGIPGADMLVSRIASLLKQERGCCVNTDLWEIMP